MFNYEERSKRENKILSDFREMIHQKINNKKWTVNHNFPFVHLLSSPILHIEFIIIIVIIIIIIVIIIIIIIILLLLLLSLSLLLF